LRREDGFESGEERVGFAGLLDSGFEKIGWLEKDGGGET
jgi:hypothetical protein